MREAISVLIKPSSGQCNMRCKYCFYRDEMSKRTTRSYGFMSEETLKNVIRRTLFRTSGSASFAFQGGEPTLRGLDFYKALVSYEKRFNKNGAKIANAIQTNGYLIDDEWCDFLAENHFLVGVSVDGTREVHDVLRRDAAGCGTFDRICQNIKCMDAHKVDYNILTVVTSSIARSAREVYELYKQNGWHYQQYIACIDDEGAEPSPYALTPRDYGQFLIDLFDVWYQDALKGDAPYIRQFENYVGMVLGYPPEACDMRGVCGVQYVVEADGSVFPCDFYMTDEYLLGNFNDDILPVLDDRRKGISFIERSKKIPSDCLRCKYLGLCRGGCMRNRVLDEQTGEYKNKFCEAYKMFFDACGERLQGFANRSPGLHQCKESVGGVAL